MSLRKQHKSCILFGGKRIRYKFRKKGLVVALILLILIQLITKVTDSCVAFRFNNDISY